MNKKIKQIKEESGKDNISGKSGLKKGRDKQRTGREYKGFSIAKGIIVSIAVLVLITLVVLITIPCVTAYEMINVEKKLPITTFPDELGFFYETYEIKAPNNKIMLGWFIPAQKKNTEEDISPSDKTVIYSHNYQSNKIMEEINLLHYVKYVVESGYNVFMFDYSGSGSSTGNGYTFGSREKDELNTVINFVADNLGCKKIALHGFAFGAASAVMAGVDNDNVQAVISDSSYTDLKEYFDNGGLEKWSHMPSFFSFAIKPAMRLFAGTDLYKDSPLEALKRANNKSFYFIHCSNDNVISPDSLDTLAASCNESNTVDKWLINNSPHLGGFLEEQENYIDNTIEFLNKVYS